MPPFNRKTKKLFYEQPFLTECSAHIVKVGVSHIELDATIAYPEGGGQEADHGTIALPDGRAVRFVDTRKLYCDSALIPNFPDIQVNGIIEHIIHEEDKELLVEFHEGASVIVHLDRLRRAQLSLSHTASHLLYLGVAEVRPDAIPGTIGCHIKTDAARFDFDMTTRFTPDEILEIQRIANAFILFGSAVTVYAHEQHPDARYWECEGRIIPCGGTHISSTTPIGSIQVRRKGLGRSKERLYCNFVLPVPDLATTLIGVGSTCSNSDVSHCHEDGPR